MAYDSTKPANDGYLADAPQELRTNFEGLKNDQIVNAGTLKGLSPGNASGNIPVSNGTVNINLNADKLDGNDASAFASAGHVHSTATSSSNGFMSNTDKSKLDGIATGAEVNQNAFSNVLVGGTTIQADSKTDTLELVAGANISLTPDSTNDRVTINNTYSHPTGDGNLHVPATGTSNNGKVLQAGSTAGSISWGTLSATDITNTAAGNISATTVQAAINELDAEKVNTSDVVTTATANKILKLDANAKLPASITGDAHTTDGYHAGTGANQLLVLDSNGKVPTGNLPNIPSANLPIASASVLGGVKIGSNLSIDGNGVLSGIASMPHSIVVYDTPGTYTWTPPQGVTQVWVTMCGGGGGGGGSHANSGGGGGGGDAVLKKPVTVTPGQNITVTVGAGGTGGPGGTNINGTAGGTSSFGAYISCPGGGGGGHGKGSNGAGGAAGGAGGVAGGGAGFAGYDTIGGAGGGCILGAGGTPICGTSSYSYAGNPGGLYGGGGSGAVSYDSGYKNGGNGAPGIVIIEY